MLDATELRAGIREALEFVTDSDVDFLRGIGETNDFLNGETIIEEGSTHRRLGILIRGNARVARCQSGNNITIAAISSPETLGEIAYLDKSGANASVISRGTSTVLFFEEPSLSSLLNAVPGLAGRLYQSLACMLARRLRLTTELAPAMQARLHCSKDLQVEDEFPPMVVESIEEFRRDMLLAQVNLKNRKTDLAETTLLAASACNNMKDTLTRYVIDEPGAGEAVGARVFREAFPFLMTSALVERSYMKPRGYAGDFETIEMLYKSEPNGAGAFGRVIDAWALGTDASQAVRSRRTKLVADVQTLLAKSEASEFAIASLAVGPGREIFDIFESGAAARVRAIGIDLDGGALAFCAEEARKRSIGDTSLRLYQDNLIRLSLGRGRVQIPKQNFIYSMGLIDYLEKGLVVKLMDWAHDQLLSGGTLAFGNFASGNRERPYMDYVLDWRLIHRTPDEMRELFSQSKFGKTEVRIDADASGIQLFAYCTKA